MRTAAIPQNPNERIATAALGLCGEAGEFADHVKKVIAQGHSLDKEYLCKEVGDILWYCAFAASALGVGLSEIATQNIDKLARRYPDGFEADKSINRVEGRASYESMD